MARRKLRIPPHLVLKLYGKHKQHDTKDVELCLLIWDNRLLCKDSSFGILPNEDQWIKFTPKTLDNVPDLSKVNLLLSPVVDKEKTWATLQYR
nr:hypothetical protein BaRGS_010034 [Batillaria attramentaria]